ncbi:hypothetical protein ABTY61_38680 [Kitasatospora sp. NPDC096128]|uniref:hypothetical protein n=1 Tax=Kitasatospora sp. NPDC096128 TaxID=3155547 RepID=UPI0033277E02
MTDEQGLRRTFEALLAEALAGRGVASCLGMDLDTDEALLAVYDAATGHHTGPETVEELVAAARRAFEGQLDGSNSARWGERLARKLAGNGH